MNWTHHCTPFKTRLDHLLLVWQLHLVCLESSNCGRTPISCVLNRDLGRLSAALRRAWSIQRQSWRRKYSFWPEYALPDWRHFGCSMNPVWLVTFSFYSWILNIECFWYSPYCPPDSNQSSLIEINCWIACLASILSSSWHRLQLTTWVASNSVAFSNAVGWAVFGPWISSSCWES